MSMRIGFAMLVLCLVHLHAAAQNEFQPAQTSSTPPLVARPTSDAAQANPTSLAPNTIANQPITQTQVTAPVAGAAQLPRQHGQVWREYNISPYTSRVKSTSKPEQAIIDWILRETGPEIWFSEPVALLSASKTTLRVYHTPTMHAVVKGIVDRFVSSQAESYVMGMRLVTVGSPNWRSKSFAMLRPINVKTPGIEAWLISKENAAVLMGDLKKRTDFQEHNSPNLIMSNGQSHTVARRRPRSYLRSVVMRDSLAGFDLDMGQFDEGFSLQVSPLFSLDGRKVDAVIRCEVDQIEQLIPIPIDVPTATGQRQRIQIQVPQVASWRVHERFLWPADHVLLLSCGVVATPGPERATPLGIPIRIKLDKTVSGRADALLFVESKGKASEVLIDAQRAAGSVAEKYRGRY